MRPTASLLGLLALAIAASSSSTYSIPTTSSGIPTRRARSSAPAALASSGLRATVRRNAMGLGAPLCNGTSQAGPVADGVLLNASRAQELPCPPAANLSLTDTFAVSWHGELSLPSLAGDGAASPPLNRTLQFRVSSSGPVRIWIQDWGVIDHFGGALPLVQAPSWQNLTLVSGVRYAVRVEFVHTGGPLAQLLWDCRLGAAPIVTALPPRGPDAWMPVPAAWLAPTVSAAEQHRLDLAAASSKGWNTWYRASATVHAHLPTGLGVALHFSDSATGFRFGDVVVDHCAEEPACRVRPGLHAPDGSFSELTLRLRLGVGGINLTVSSAHIDAAGDASVLLVEANTTALAGVGWAMLPAFDYFDCGSQALPCGTVAFAPDGRSATASPAGFPDVSVRVAGDLGALGPGGRPAASAAAAVAGGGGLGASSGSAVCISLDARGQGALNLTVAECRDAVAHSRRVYAAGLDGKFDRAKVGRLRDGAEAMRSVIAWNTMWDRRVRLVTPVSRDFGPQPYALWLWDTLFLALQAAEGSRAIAYSNLIAVVSGGTNVGQLPGMQLPNGVTTDRTKPMVGARVLREVFAKYGELWLVQLLYPKLLAWNSWMLQWRLEGPANLITLGTYNVRVNPSSFHNREAAVWESGLDNSPMYDANNSFWDPDSALLRIYDVGQTAYFLSECESLAVLARVLGLAADVAELEARFQAMQAALQRHLWDPERLIFANRVSLNGQWIDSLTPTSFFPMMSGSATVEQAEAMVQHWLMTDQGFCLGAGAGNSTRAELGCRFGPPSVAHSDPAYGDQNYWRGRVWGPFNALTYWGLTHPKYNQSKVVQAARKALVDNSLDLLLVEWLDKHHVHENFNAATGRGGDVSHSNPFYHWGALLGWIGVFDAGLY